MSDPFRKGGKVRLITVNLAYGQIAPLPAGNTVGSQKGMINLSLPQKQILYGTILGDAYLQKTGQRNARLRLEHSQKQRDYLLWKVKMLQPLFQGKPKFIERIHPVTKRKYGYWRHQSQSTPYLGRLRRIFYPEGKKQIPDNLEKYLSPRTLAVWYMDDGYYSFRDKSGYLYLGKITQKEAEIVSQTLKKMFGLKNKILDKKKKGYVIYFSPRTMLKLKELIKDYLLPQFSYRIPF